MKKNNSKKIIILMFIVFTVITASISFTSCDGLCQALDAVTDIVTSSFGFGFLADINFCEVAEVFNFGNDVEDTGISVDGDTYDGAYSFFSDTHVKNKAESHPLHPNYIAGWALDDVTNAVPTFITRTGTQQVAVDGKLNETALDERVYCDPSTGEELIGYEDGSVVCGFVLNPGEKIKDSSYPISRDGDHPTSTSVETTSNSKSGLVKIKIPKEQLLKVLANRRKSNYNEIIPKFKVVNREEYLAIRSPYFDKK